MQNSVSLSSQSSSNYQIQKLYLYNLLPETQPNEWEALLFAYFSSFGVIIDLKVLRSSFLNRQFWLIRLHNFQRRRSAPGNHPPQTLRKQPKSSLTRFPSLAPKTSADWNQCKISKEMFASYSSEECPHWLLSKSSRATSPSLGSWLTPCYP